MTSPFRTAFCFFLGLLILCPGIPAWGEGAPVLGADGPWPATDGFPYLGRTVPLQWVELASSGTLIPIYDEEYYSAPLPIGFTFPFYNQSFSSFYVNANGFITFNPKNEALDYSIPQCPLPNSDAPDNLIAILWGDLGLPNPAARMNVYYKSFSSCPTGPAGAGPCLIVEYKDVTFAVTKEKAGTFEAVLFASGDILLQYQDVGATVGQGSNLYTVGIENGNAGLGYGLTYLCNTPYKLTAGTALQFTRNFLSLTPENQEVKTCNGQATSYTFELKNFTGAAGNFQLDCSVSYPGTSIKVNGQACPQTLALGSRGTASLTAVITPPACTPPGLLITATLNAAGNNAAAGATLKQRLYQNGVWDQIPPEPEYCRQDIVAGTYGGKIWSIAGAGDSTVRTYDPATRTWSIVNAVTNGLNLDNWAHSGCQHGSKVYFYGDGVTAGFTGLWAFDMAASPPTASKVSSGGPPSGKLFMPAWAYDAESGLCYLTGGADTEFGNTKDTVYVYNPAGNTWLPPLSGMTTTRKRHAAFAFKRPADNHKLLCVAGGVKTFYYPNETFLDSTQCYDLTAGSWSTENADLGVLPHSWWGMGYTQRQESGTDQLWLIAGVVDGAVSNLTMVFNGGSWLHGGNTFTSPVYRTSAVTLNQEIYKIGGLYEFSAVCSADQFKVCSTCSEWIADQAFFPLIRK